jgi:uncharacterized membrane protein
MAVLVVVVQWLHVLMGVLWVGGAVFLDLVAFPSGDVLPLPQRRLLGQNLGRHAGHFFALAGTATLLLGIVRGTVVGPIQSPAALGSAYGRTWLVALALTGGLAIWGARVVGPAAEQLYAEAHLWAPDAQGCPSRALTARLRHLAVLTRVQLAGFAAVIACMILMAEVFS